MGLKVRAATGRKTVTALLNFVDRAKAPAANIMMLDQEVLQQLSEGEG